MKYTQRRSAKAEFTSTNTDVPTAWLWMVTNTLNKEETDIHVEGVLTEVCFSQKNTDLICSASTTTLLIPYKLKCQNLLIRLKNEQVQKQLLHHNFTETLWMRRILKNSSSYAAAGNVLTLLSLSHFWTDNKKHFKEMKSIVEVATIKKQDYAIQTGILLTSATYILC